MSETTNYHLFVTDDSTMTFKNVREKVYGETDSNMVKIDTALAGKAAMSQTTEYTLQASAWSGDVPPYTQVLLVEGLSATQNGVIGVSQNITPEQMEAVCDAELYVSSQSDGEMTISAKGNKPEVDIPVSIIFIG